MWSIAFFLATRRAACFEDVDNFVLREVVWDFELWVQGLESRELCCGKETVFRNVGSSLKYFGCDFIGGVVGVVATLMVKKGI